MSKMMEADVAIVGGGLAGLSLAALLGAQGVCVICIDRDDPNAQLDARFDGRTTAISYGSRLVLEQAGELWSRMESAPSGTCAIEAIHILDGDSDVLLNFQSHEVGGRAFGWIVDNLDMRRALFEQARTTPSITHLAPAQVSDFDITPTHGIVHMKDGRCVRASLIIGADGRQSFTRQWMGIGTRKWSYRQQAIVCTVHHENPHNNTAIEHFRAAGPFAVLPMNDDAKGRHRSAVVWTEHGRGANGVKPPDALHWPRDVFDAALNARFPSWYGRVTLAGERFAYPLGLVHAHHYTAPRMALVAEAAHGIHPIAGQGLNMGLRDIAALAGLIVPALQAGEDIGGNDLLASYQRLRRFDNMAMAGATDTLNRLFAKRLPPIVLSRALGMRAIARIPAAKQFFMKQAMGAAGLLPAMMRDTQI